MEKCIIFYDDKPAEKAFAAELCAEDERLISRSSGIHSEAMIYRENASNIGFVLHSEGGKLTDEMENLMKRIVMPKSNYIFMVVCSGIKERKTLKAAYDLLQSRGYRVAKVFTEGMLLSESANRKEQVKTVIHAIEAQETCTTECSYVTDRGLRNEIRHYLKEMRRRKKKNKKKKT